jgi:hypothetical protein
MGTFRLKVKGRKLKPKDVPLLMLTEQLQSFVPALLQTAKARGIDASADDFSLLRVCDGSLDTILGVPVVLIPILLLLTKGQLAETEPIAMWLSSFRSMSSERGWELHAEVDEVEEASAIMGRTYIYGLCMGLGGNEPTITLKTPRQSRPVLVRARAEELQGLVGRLYTEIGLEVDATWQLPSGVISQATLVSVLPYQQTGIKAAFTALREAANGAFDDIDSATFVSELRGMD